MKSYFKWWKRHKFKFAVWSSIGFLLGWYFFYGKHSVGTWSLQYEYTPQPIVRQKRAPTHSKGENECRRVMETLFRKPFPSMRPDFLKNRITGKNLEIDCCNLELMLGVEYNGKQHYEFVPAIHRTRETFQNQQYRDKMKQELCDQHNFTLITVPYTIPIHEIEAYIKNRLHSSNLLL